MGCKMKYVISLCLALLLSACDKPKGVFDYYKEAQAYMQANETSKAEAILKEGIINVPTDSDLLKYELVNLYLITDLEKAEKYLEVARFPSSGFLTRVTGELATKYFEAKNWPKAFKYCIAYGDDDVFSAPSSSNPCSTRNAASESYRNAAAAAYNLRNKQLMRDALEKIPGDARKQTV